MRAYLLASHLLPLHAKRLLRKRMVDGKEHPARWVEKLGQSLAPRPHGTLVWLHAVGLGEVLSLRGLIAMMASQRPDLSFLVTSTTKASAAVFATQLPPRTIHQFLPIDAPQYRRRFLDHFSPDLCIWAEQDIWPGFVSDLDKRGIPQCLIAARMDAASLQKHQRAATLFGDVYGAMRLVTAQDETTAAHLREFGVRPDVTGSLKPAAPPLDADDAALADLMIALDGRFVWGVAPAHPDDIEIAIAANQNFRETQAGALLIIVPRFPDQFDVNDWPRRSLGQVPQPDDTIWVVDTFGELGLVYQLARATLIGGTFGGIKGHNPWEAIALGSVVMHGPQTANFASDYATLQADAASVCVTTPLDITNALAADNHDDLRARATACMKALQLQTTALAQRLIAVLDQ